MVFYLLQVKSGGVRELLGYPFILDYLFKRLFFVCDNYFTRRFLA